MNSDEQGGAASRLAATAWRVCHHRLRNNVPKNETSASNLVLDHDTREHRKGETAANHRPRQLWAIGLKERVQSKSVLEASLLQSAPNIVLHRWENKWQADQVMQPDWGVIAPYRRAHRGNQAKSICRNGLRILRRRAMMGLEEGQYLVPDQ